MAYEKQTFLDEIKDENGNVTQEGTVLKAENLNHMEDGIAEANKAIVSVGGDTLTWDGNTEGLENAPSPTVAGMTIYKISDNAITFADLSQGLTVTNNGETETLTPDTMTDVGAAVFFDFGLFVNEESAEIPGYTVGIYVFDSVSSLTIPGYTGFAKKQINPEYLPEDKIVLVTADYDTLRLSHTPEEILELQLAGKSVISAATSTPFSVRAGITVTAETLTFSMSGDNAYLDINVNSFDENGYFVGMATYQVAVTTKQ